MRKHLKYGSICLVMLILLVACKASKIIKLATSGEIENQTFYQEIDFRYINQHIFIDVEINGKTHNFLFDTGWEITSIDQSLLDDVDVKPSLKNKTSGSSFEDHKVKYGYIDHIKINGLEFKQVGVGVDKLSFINKHYPEDQRIDGIIGTNIFQQAHWQIDYRNRKIRFTNQWDRLNLGSERDTISLTPRNKSGWGLKKVEVSLDGYVSDFAFDTGSSGGFTMDTSHFHNIVNERNDTLVEVEDDWDKKGAYSSLINQLRINNIRLTNKEISFEPNVSSLIGNDFLENYLVTVNWEENFLLLSAVKDHH